MNKIVLLKEYHTCLDGSQDYHVLALLVDDCYHDVYGKLNYTVYAHVGQHSGGYMDYFKDLDPCIDLLDSRCIDLINELIDYMGYTDLEITTLKQYLIYY